MSQRSSRPEPPSVLRVRADCGGRLFAAKLNVVVHYLPHQLLDHLLADEALLLACQFCNGLRNGGAASGAPYRASRISATRDVQALA